MKHTHNITTGKYDGYRIVATIEGENTLKIPRLFLMFLEVCGLTIEDMKSSIADGHNRVTTATVNDFYTKCNRKAQAVKDMHSKGYTGVSLSELFVDWLIKDQQFKHVKNATFYVED